MRFFFKGILENLRNFRGSAKEYQNLVDAKPKII